MSKRKLTPRNRELINSELSMFIEEWIERYIKYLEVLLDNNELSEHTLRTYKHTLDTLIYYIKAYIDKNASVNNIDEFIVSDFILWVTQYEDNYVRGSLDEVKNDLEEFLKFYHLKKNTNMIDEVVNDYAKHIEVERGLLDAVFYNIESYESFLYNSSLHPGSESIKKYLEYLKKSRKSATASTLRLKRAAISAFFHYIDLKTRYKYNLETVMKLVPKYNKKNRIIEKKIFTTDLFYSVANMFLDVKPIKKEIPNKREYSEYRARLLGSLMLHGGLRSAEAISLKIEDIVLHSSEGIYEVHVRKGKGNKSRTVIIKIQSIQPLIDFVLKYKKTNFMYYSSVSDSSNIKHSNLYLLINKLYRENNIMSPENSSEYLTGLHILRHLYASMLAKSENITLVKEALGHSSINTTQIYVDVDIEDLKKAAISFTKI